MKHEKNQDLQNESQFARVQNGNDFVILGWVVQGTGRIKLAF